MAGSEVPSGGAQRSPPNAEQEKSQDCRAAVPKRQHAIHKTHRICNIRRGSKGRLQLKRQKRAVYKEPCLTDGTRVQERDGFKRTSGAPSELDGLGRTTEPNLRSSPPSSVFGRHDTQRHRIPDIFSKKILFVRDEQALRFASVKDARQVCGQGHGYPINLKKLPRVASL